MVHDHKQHPLASGFASSCTADDVLRGIDMSANNVVITGGHSGIGLETTRALSKAGAAMVVGARNPDRAGAALHGVDHVEVWPLDLADPASIDDFVMRYLDTGRALHILINNAGVALHKNLERDSRGYEAQFATNYLGHFQLTLGLFPALRSARGARVVNLSSGGHRLSDIRWDDLHFDTGYQSLLAYAQSKTAAVLFAVELDRRWAEYRIRGYAVHPGIVAGTTLNSSVGDDQLKATGLMDGDGQPVVDLDRGIKAPQQGASTTVFAATSPVLAEIGGIYLKDNDISELDDNPQELDGSETSPPAEVVPHAIDPDSARRLWEISERLLAD